jgi:uncharacterized protein (TIGR03000 family)
MSRKASILTTMLLAVAVLILALPKSSHAAPPNTGSRTVPQFSGFYIPPYYGTLPDWRRSQNWGYGYYPDYYFYPQSSMNKYSYPQLPSGSYHAQTIPDSSPSTPGDVSGHITVTVPADAKVWFGDSLMASSGPIRDFDSPPLATGKRYTYTIHATWKDDGQEVTQTQKIEFTPGQHVDVRFPVKSKSEPERK